VKSEGLYAAAGGRETCLRLSEAFYARVAQDPLLRPLFPSTFRCAIEAFAAFLAQLLGGPAEDAKFRFWLSLRESHLRFKIGRAEREAWLANMANALDDAQIAEPLRGAWWGLFERSSAWLVNSGPAPEQHFEPPRECIHQQMVRKWEAQIALDEAVAALRSGDADRAIALADGLRGNRSVFAGFLAIMCGHSELLSYIEQELRRDPALARERCGGRTLLHAAAGAADLATVELLLRLSPDSNVIDAALYCLGNECTIPGGGAVVRALVRSGADVNARQGVKHCTPLHMAARRGNTEVAEALLDSGAEIEARDSAGDTPLRRAVNCGKTGVVALLLSRGAGVHSKGSQGLTPLLAARTPAMRRLLER